MLRCLCLSLIACAAFPQGRLEDYQRSASLRDRLTPLTAGSIAGNNIEWIGKSSQFWYSRTTAAGHEYVIANASGERRPAFDHARLATAIEAAGGPRQPPEKLDLAAVQFAADLKSVEFRLENSLFRADLDKYTVEKTGARNLPAFGSIVGPRIPDSPIPVASPDKRWELYTANFNVWLRDKSNPKIATALTTDGSEGDYYAITRAAWSPDSQKAAVFRVRPGLRRQITYIESSPATQVQPRTIETTYVKPGDTLDIPRPVLLDIAARRATPVDPALFPNPYAITNLAWRPDSRAFTFEYNERGHQVYRIIEVDAVHAKAGAIVDEQSPTFYCYYSKRYRRDLESAPQTIWMSERSGWNHIYLIDNATGRVIHPITSGEWVVREVLAVDESTRHVYFLASGVDAGRDPYFRHLYRVSLDGKNLTRLSTVDADHRVTIAPDFRSFTAIHSRPDLPPVTELRRTTDGSLIAALEKVDPAPLRAAGFRAPEVFTAKARDGATDIWGLIYRPSNFDATKKYPVLEYIYAGPHDSFVPKSFSAAHPMQAMAELGFVVVQMDGMGTSNRSKAFHDVCWKNIGDAGFADRILWHKAAAAKFPWYDLARLGIYGHSAGGQNSLGALLFHGDFYKAAVSSAGCHDNRMDKIMWNEQWMGWPVGPEYAASSNVEHAARLKGKLLLAVGELDTNVDPASTMQVVNALIKAGKTFDLLFLPGANHGGWGDYWERKRADFFVRNLLSVDPPDWNTVPPPTKQSE